MPVKENLIRQFYELEKNPNKWTSVFQSINTQTNKRAKALKLSCKVAFSADNVDKNRYRDISPYDQNRIILGSEDDYINASPVPVEETSQNYILCQGPLDETSADFWQMVWEKDVPTIVMLNKLIERGMLKCAPYFPSLSIKTMTFKPYTITCDSEEEEGDFTVRHLSLQKEEEEGEVKKIVHIQYTEWPDFGVPKCTGNLLHLMRRYWELHGRDSSSPAIVHCSAGVGRSGTFVVVDTVIRMAESDKEVDMEKLIVRLREKRMGLIQTPQQLRFSWQTIVDYLQGDSSSSSHGDDASSAPSESLDRSDEEGRKRDLPRDLPEGTTAEGDWTQGERVAKRQAQRQPGGRDTVYRREETWRGRWNAVVDGVMNTFATMLG